MQLCDQLQSHMRNSNLISVHLVLSNLITQAISINMYVLIAVCAPQSQDGCFHLCISCSERMGMWTSSLHMGTPGDKLRTYLIAASFNPRLLQLVKTSSMQLITEIAALAISKMHIFRLLFSSKNNVLCRSYRHRNTILNL